MVLSAALAQVAWYELAHKWMNSSAFLRRPPLNLAPSPSASLTFQAESLLALPGPAQVPLLRWTTVGQAPVASVACSRFSCLETTYSGDHAGGTLRPGGWLRKRRGAEEPALLSWGRVFSASSCSVANSDYSWVFVPCTLTTFHILSHRSFGASLVAQMV